MTVLEHGGLGHCKLHVLNQTPGSVCTKEGDAVVWPTGQGVKPAMIDGEGNCTFLHIGGDIPYLIPNDPRDEDTAEENRKRLVEHLEPLIVRMKDGSSMPNESSPKATAGEEVGAEYSSSEAGHDDIEGLFDDVKPLRREEEPAREEADEPVEDHDRLVRG